MENFHYYLCCQLKGGGMELFMKNLQLYKFSKYNHKILLKGKLYLYNAFSGGFCSCDNLMKSVFLNLDFETDPCEKLSGLPEKYIMELRRGKFIIDKDLDEFQLVKSRHYLARFSKENALGLTIIPTHACNFRCPYCFEADKEYKNDKMTEEVMDAILVLIDSKLRENGVLSICWFGGEPLLALDIIEKLQGHILELSKRKCFSVYSSIVTNGYLLTNYVAKKLFDLQIKTIQITLDGDRNTHDMKRRLAKSKVGTFDRIIENIKSIDNQLKVSVRINIDKDNIDVMNKLIDYICSIKLNLLSNVQFYFAIIKDYDSKGGKALCSYLSVKEFSETEIGLIKYAESRGIHIHKNINPNIGVCGSLSPNSLVIEPDGMIQKCWGLVGNKETAVGNLLEEGTDREKYLCNQVKWLSWSAFEKKECKECNILPLCMGGCPLHSLDETLDDSFKCHTYKYNLEKILMIMAEEYIKDKLKNK